MSEQSNEIIEIVKDMCIITYLYLNFGLKKLANFCKQFSHFEILKMTTPLKFNLD